MRGWRPPSNQNISILIWGPAFIDLAPRRSRAVPVPFSLLCDDKEFGKTRDPAIVYALGCAFSEALLRVCGEHAPARVLEEFKRAKFKGNAHGETLWREIFQGCGYSLDAVTAAYDAELSQWQMEHADFIARLPAISSSVSTREDAIVVHPEYSGTAPGRLVCCVEYPGTIAPDLRWYHPEPDGSFSIPRSGVTGVTFRYMLGWSMKEEFWAVFEKWSEAPR